MKAIEEESESFGTNSGASLDRHLMTKSWESVELRVSVVNARAKGGIEGIPRYKGGYNT
jgi:hypothetical protein